MKKLILLASVALTFASCEKPHTEQIFNTKDGFYSVDLISVSQSGWAGGIDSDTTITDLCYLATDYGLLYTINRDSAVSPIPVLGFNFQSSFEFGVTVNDTAVQIGTETWFHGIIDGKLNITRVTNYQGMGMDTQTLILTELK